MITVLFVENLSGDFKARAFTVAASMPLSTKVVADISS